MNRTKNLQIAAIQDHPYTRMIEMIREAYGILTLLGKEKREPKIWHGHVLLDERAMATAAAINLARDAAFRLRTSLGGDLIVSSQKNAFRMICEDNAPAPADPLIADIAHLTGGEVVRAAQDLHRRTATGLTGPEYKHALRVAEMGVQDHLPQAAKIVVRGLYF